MDFRIEEGKQQATLYFAGEIDMTVGEQLGDLLRQCGERFEQIAIDFYEVTFVDSSGIGNLFYAAKELLARGKRIEIINIREEILDILQMLGFFEALGIPLRRAE